MSWMSRLARRLSTELRDAIECVLVPGLAAVLPWPLAYAAFRLLSRWAYLYRAATEQSLVAAQTMGFAGDARLWRRHRRILHMVDHADYFLARTRSNRWMARHLTVQGQWPAPQAALLCTFHWGAGMWGLRHAGSAGLAPHALVAPLNRAHFAGRSVYFHYNTWRNAAVGRALGTQPLDTSASLRPVLRALRQGEQVLAAIDVPSDQVAASEAIDFLGRRARVPRGLLRVAFEQQVPVVVYLTGVRLRDGARFLRIHPVGVAADLDGLMRTVFAYLEAAVREEPVAWHFWFVADRFFEPANS